MPHAWCMASYLSYLTPDQFLYIGNNTLESQPTQHSQQYTTQSGVNLYLAFSRPRFLAMNPGYFDVTPAENELQVRLYLHHYHSGPNKNQIDVVYPNGPNSFGSIVVNDWPLTDGFEPNGNVIARAQGMHIQSSVTGSSWYNSLNLVFQDERFKGSTLEVKGTHVTEGEWAIVGGTGQFAKAQGVIYKRRLPEHDTQYGDIMEVTILATYTPLQKPT